MTFFPHRARHAAARKLGVGLVGLAALCAVPALAQAPAPDPVLARVNGTEIRQSDVAMAEEELGGQLPGMPDDAKRDYIVTYLADTILVAQEAEKKKFGDDPKFARKLAFARNKLLSESLLEQEAKAATTDEAMREIYGEASKKMAAEKEVHASHILVETEDEAKAIVAELKKGADFAKLAKEKSKDPGAADGGDLGFFAKDQMVPEFAEAAFKLEPGKISDPVKSQFGWHVIKVQESRNRPVPEFDKVKEQIQGFLVRRKQTELVAKLRGDAKIERLDAPAAAPAQPAAPAAPASPAAPKN
ncbi:MAG: peptidylprolyl isomerase [Rhizobiales bacterium]|nr:peptidylprolyl isomerase [Hyphomicrobiales bacterium]